MGLGSNVSGQIANLSCNPQSHHLGKQGLKINSLQRTCIRRVRLPVFGSPKEVSFSASPSHPVVGSEAPVAATFTDKAT
jgi:hypothetical protein